DKFRFEDGYLKNPGQPYSTGNSADFTANQTGEKTQAKESNAGIVLSSRLNKRMTVTVGYAMYHINKPQSSLLGKGKPDPSNPNPPTGGSGSYRLSRRSIAHGQFSIQMNDRMTITPQFMYQTMAGHDEIQVQGMMGYLFNPEKDITLNFGIGYRLRDAISPIVGAKIKNLRVGLAYDVNISDLNAYSNYRGGFELAAYYIIKIYKPAVVKPKVLCPRY
ncbi:MAG TPA: type IX secretion system membrane protein PorP/SprF, partial [Saprospiraceae bacterium]|nr:type IX secretion system membrane protein PorP/SprF [Saprospiraceae bacterium]